MGDFLSPTTSQASTRPSSSITLRKNKHENARAQSHVHERARDDRDSEEEIRSSQAQIGTCQDDRHLVAASSVAVSIEVKGRVPATFRVPDAVRGGRSAPE